MKVSKPLTLTEIRLTLGLHVPYEAWLPLSLYNIWSHLLPLICLINVICLSILQSVMGPCWSLSGYCIDSGYALMALQTVPDDLKSD
jgi:hypothetical protein